MLIDLAAAARPLTEEELRIWAGRERVFISSVMDELAEERKAIASAVRQLGAEPVWFEDFGGRDDEPTRAYLAEVATSTIYVAILGRSYGRLTGTRRSATHEEYREAEGRGLRISVWVRDGSDRQGDQQVFLDEIRLFHTTGRFSDPVSLAVGVEGRLKRIAAEELSPWAKLGDVVVRATTIRHDGKRLQVRASVRDPEVLSSLEAMRPGFWFGSGQLNFTWGTRSLPVRVEEIATETRVLGVTDVDVVLAAEAPPDPMLFAVQYNLKTYSPDDITESALRQVLFGESAPASLLSLGATMPDPMTQISSSRLSEEVLRPILRLLLTEALVGSGRASSVTSMRLGAPVEGRRRLVLAWQGRSGAGQVGGSRRIEGEVRLD
jgi:hypothetical protein